jgi:hypothetical protein
VLDRPGPQTFEDLFLDILGVVGERISLEMAATTEFEVSARGRISFNGRMSTEYTDPGVELTAGPLAASDWLRTAP